MPCNSYSVNISKRCIDIILVKRANTSHIFFGGVGGENQNVCREYYTNVHVVMNFCRKYVELHVHYYKERLTLEWGGGVKKTFCKLLKIVYYNYLTKVKPSLAGKEKACAGSIIAREKILKQ